MLFGGLAAMSGAGGKLLLDRYRKSDVPSPYDVIIRINSLAALETSGWEIVFGHNIDPMLPDAPRSENKHGVVVSVLGSYNRGKSFLLNQLCSIHLPNGNLVHTEGISLTTAKKHVEDVVFIDTAGTDTAIPKDKLDDKKATEALLREIALYLCSFIIIVVNRLRATDQTYIQQVLMNSKNSNRNQSIIIVHNLMDVETMEDAQKIIKYEVESLFDAAPDKMTLGVHGQSMRVNFFRSINNGIKIRHFIMAKHDSSAAAQWNKQSIDGIMNILQTSTDNRRDLDVIADMIGFVNTKLPQLFLEKEDNEAITRDGDHPRLQVQMHSRKPYIVLAQRKDRENLEEDPYPLALSPKLVYDDAGYFIGISSMNKGQWQPLYSLYDSEDEILVLVELAGFKKEEVKTKVVEDSITMTGRREDYKKALKNPVTHREQIPMGQFTLEIPLHHKIENKEARLEREDGLYKIICPKKKASATFLWSSNWICEGTDDFYRFRKSSSFSLQYRNK